MLGRIAICSLGLLVLLAIMPGLAAAEVPHCATADSDLSVDASLFSPMAGDTGWLPSGSPAQVRVIAQVDGQTTVAMGLAPRLCWNSGTVATVPGRSQAGMLSFAYGAELQVFGRIHASVLGLTVNWDGQIPIPYVPSDMLLANTATFEPPNFASAIGASDTTGTIHVLQNNQLGSLLGIPGVSGGLNIDVIGAMTTQFKPTSITTPAGDITTDGGQVSVTPPSGGFAGGLDFNLSSTGVVTYSPKLTFNIGFNVQLIGITVVNVTLASVPMNLPAINRTISLTGSATRIPLASVTAGTRLDFSMGGTQMLHLVNHGEAPLVVEVASAPTGVTAQPITIAAGGDGQLAVTAAVTAGLAGTLTLATNDPNQEQLAIQVGVDIGGTDNPPTTEPDQAGGCNAGGGNAGWLLALAAAITLRRRRSVWGA